LWQNSLAHLKGRQIEHDFLLGAYWSKLAFFELEIWFEVS
jgi:hypothetical protein